jgi:hypothetical protein
MKRMRKRERERETPVQFVRTRSVRSIKHSKKCQHSEKYQYSKSDLRKNYECSETHQHNKKNFSKKSPVQ